MVSGYMPLSELMLTQADVTMASLGHNDLTHWGRDKMAAIFQTPFSNAFSWMEIYEFRLRFHLSLFLGAQLTIIQYWFRYWLGAGQAPSHSLNHWWLVCWRIYTSLPLNELKTKTVQGRLRGCQHVSLFIIMAIQFHWNYHIRQLVHCMTI